MNLHALILSLSVGFLTLIAPSLHAEQDMQKLLVDELQDNPKAFDLIELKPLGSATDFHLILEESVLTLSNGEKLGGFRFKAPKGAENSELVWYFNAPSNWAHWYLCPVKGAFKPSFKSWLDAGKVYKPFDKPSEKDRSRILQTLDAGYFKSGEEYIMWFRQLGEGDSRLSGRILFTENEEDWDDRKIEKVLKLNPLPTEAQVKALNSIGGKILLDRKFFNKGYAANRIDNVFYSIRRSRRLRGGMFISVQVTAPPCDSNPSFTKIRKRYGEPDFIQTGAERNTIAKHNGIEVDHDPNIITYFYDYFGFEVNKNDPNAIVENVVTHAHDFSKFRSNNKNPSFAQISMLNLTVFSKGDKEVGRIYYFLEGHKEPLCIMAPPKGRYERGDQVLEYNGNEKWRWLTYFQDGSVAREIPFAGHRMNGKAEGFHTGGKPSFVVSYKDGLLDGRIVEYSEEGEIINEAVFVDGKQQDEYH